MNRIKRGLIHSHARKSLDKRMTGPGPGKSQEPKLWQQPSLLLWEPKMGRTCSTNKDLPAVKEAPSHSRTALAWVRFEFGCRLCLMGWPITLGTSLLEMPLRVGFSIGVLRQKHTKNLWAMTSLLVVVEANTSWVGVCKRWGHDDHFGVGNDSVKVPQR
jgi:hypothetical protein